MKHFNLQHTFKIVTMFRAQATGRIYEVGHYDNTYDDFT